MEIVSMILKSDDIHGGHNGHEDEDDDEEIQKSYESGLPSSIIVSNLYYQFFDDFNERENFQSIFLDIDESATFHYFKSFKRVRINFSTPDQASQARYLMHLKEYNGQVVKCYFTQPILIGNSSHLEPPKREKQFLISPPASPPLDWKPKGEAVPAVDYDLLSAVASLAPGEAHELHPPTDDHPAIIVHICEQEEGELSLNPAGVRIPQTACPERPQ